MTVTPIDLSTLPRESSQHAAATRFAARVRGGIPERATLDVAPLGPVTLAWAGMASPKQPVAGAVAFGVARDGHRGRLSLDARLTRALLAALVERREPPVLRRLGAAERGLVAGLVAVLLDRLGSDLSLSLAAPPPGPVAGALALTIDVAAPGVAGRAVLEAPPAMLVARAPGAVWAARAAALPVEARLEIAATRIAAGALVAVEPGDAVVFDGVPALPSGGAQGRRARLVIGDAGVEVALDGADASRVTVVEVFRPLGRAVGVTRSGEEIDMGGKGTSPEAVRALAAAPIEVVAEIGRVQLRGDEVVGLAPGAVLTLPGVRSALVSLRVGAEVWAEGELVSVDGELGVRVTAVHRREPAR